MMERELLESLTRIEGTLALILETLTKGQKSVEGTKEEINQEESFSLGTLFKEEINKEERKEEKKKAQRKIFVKPTLEEVQAYIKEKGLRINAEYFYDHYEANGWCIGHAKMKDWKATLRKWASRRNPKSGDYNPEFADFNPFKSAKEMTQEMYKNPNKFFSDGEY